MGSPLGELTQLRALGALLRTRAEVQRGIDQLVDGLMAQGYTRPELNEALRAPLDHVSQRVLDRTNHNQEGAAYVAE